MSYKNSWQKRPNLVKHLMKDSSDQQQESQLPLKMYNWVVKLQHQHKSDGDLHKKRRQKTQSYKQVKKDHQNSYKSLYHKKDL